MPIIGYGIDFILIDDVDEAEEKELPICEKCVLEIAQVMYAHSQTTLNSSYSPDDTAWDDLPPSIMDYWLQLSLAANKRVFQIARHGHTKPH